MIRNLCTDKPVPGVFLWLPSAEFAIDRVADRVRLGGHSVPEETIASYADTEATDGLDFFRRYLRGMRPERAGRNQVCCGARWRLIGGAAAVNLGTIASEPRAKRASRAGQETRRAESVAAGLRARPAPLVRGSSRRITIMRFRTAMSCDHPVSGPGFRRELQQAVWSVDSHLPLAIVRTLDEIQADSMAQTSFAMVMLAIAASVMLGSTGVAKSPPFTAISLKRAETSKSLTTGAISRF
jgi:hypothetical protein